MSTATAGSTAINSVNADSLARSGGSVGTSSVVTLDSGTGGTMSGGSSGYQSVAGAGPARLYRIPDPSIGVDLGNIRRGLLSAPSATPDGLGD